MRSRFLNALEGEGSEQERALFDGEGELRQYRTTYTPVCIGEVVTGVAIVLVDITEELSTQAGDLPRQPPGCPAHRAAPAHGGRRHRGAGPAPPDIGPAAGAKPR